MAQNIAIIGPTELFVCGEYDQHMIDYRWNKRMQSYQLDKRADAVKIEVARIIMRMKP